MLTSSTHSSNDFFTALANAEGKSYVSRIGQVNLQPTASANSTDKDQFKTSPTFSIQPKILFNQMSNGDWSFDQLGFIKISTNLSRNGHALNGDDMVNDTTYKIKNLRLEYMTVPEDGVKAKILAKSYVLVKSVVNSTVHNLSARVSAVASNGVVVSYLEQSKENSLIEDTLELDVLPQTDSISYLFNSSQQKYLTYSLTDRSEMVSKGVEVLNQNAAHNLAKGDNLASNQGYLTGLPFSETINLSNQRFTVQTSSSNVSIGLKPYNQYCYFTTILMV